MGSAIFCPGSRASASSIHAFTFAASQRTWRQTGIDVEVQSGLEEKVTIGFENTPLEDAIKRLSENNAIFYTKEPNEPTYRIAKVTVHSKGTERAEPVRSKEAQSEIGKTSGATPQPSVEKDKKPEPFRFTFDPLTAPAK